MKYVINLSLTLDNEMQKREIAAWLRDTLTGLSFYPLDRSGPEALVTKVTVRSVDKD